MRHAASFLFLLVLACRTGTVPTPSTPPIPPESPPPLPERNTNVAHIEGRVLDAEGRGVDGARITAWGAGSDCRPEGYPVVTIAGPAGEYALSLERGVGPDEWGCIAAEARAGGALTNLERPILFTAAKGDRRSRLDLEISLPRAPILTRAEGERLIGVLVAALKSGDEAAIEELDLYIRGDRQRVNAALDAYRQYLRGVSEIEFVDAEGSHWMRWRLTGAAGRTVPTSVYRETLIELHGPLIDFGDRGAGFVRRILDLAHQGDPERMARLLTADDEEVPLETAQRVIDHLRARFDLPRASVVLAGVDDAGNVLRYRVSGSSREGTASEEILEVGYGDGLVWLRGF